MIAVAQEYSHVSDETMGCTDTVVLDLLGRADTDSLPFTTLAHDGQQVDQALQRRGSRADVPSSAAC